MKKSFQLLFIPVFSCALLLAGCNDKKGESITKYKYEIEDAVSDETFSSVIEGKLVPVEIKFGMGGESGYEQFSTKDSEMISAYIEALRAVRIKKVITDEEDMFLVNDGIEDYSFIMEDGTKTGFGTDLSTYIMDRENNKQYVLDNTDELDKLNDKIRGRADS